MAKTISQIRKEWVEIQNDLSNLAQSTNRDMNVVRKAVRDKILRGQEINSKSEIETLLKKEYELEKEETKLSMTLELIMQGKDPKSPTFQHELDILVTREELNQFDKKQIDDYRKDIQKRVVFGVLIPTADIPGQLLLREIQNERELKRMELQENALTLGFEKDSPLFNKYVELKMLQSDMGRLDSKELSQYTQEFKNKKNQGENIDLSNGYFKLIQKEKDITEEFDRIAREEEQKKLQEKFRQEELNKKVAEEAVKEVEKSSKGLFARFRNLFRRKPKETPVITEPVKEEPKKEEPAKTETVKEEVQQEETTNKKKVEVEQVLSEEEKQRQESRKKEEEERNRKYKVEFAGKELRPEIKGCSDPKKLKEYLEDATLSKNPEVREHLEARILANAKIQSFETSRTMLQKNRPPAVKYKDGTILLKNKKKDVPKQTSMNGCWSAVLSDMLGHFGVELSQEEIRAYRPDLNNDPSQKLNGNALMERLNKDAMNEINDMADLIQRTVPNVAHHHMSLGASREENKAVLKETVADALLNKNSPVAVLYGNHYLSIVGIKDNTLIVQNPSPTHDSKYQKLSIDDLFAGCKHGQVTIDWLEDLKFQKDGTCKNVTEQWKNMGIQCDKREFKAGDTKNYVSHVRGNEYYDASRIAEGIEETIYLPKMSFGKEKDMAAVEIKQQQMENVKQGMMTMEDVQKHDAANVKDEPEIQEFDLNPDYEWDFR